MDLDKIISMIIEGKNFRQIAKELKKPLSTLHDFTSRPEHSARVRDALNISADTYADMAEDVLKNAEGNKEELYRARELAQHYRWMAAKRRPKTYSEKMDITSEGKQIPAPQIIIMNTDDETQL